MRFNFSADKEFWDQVSFLQKNHRVDKTISGKEVVLEAIQMLFQINVLLENGYKISIVDPKGKKHLLGKNKDNENGQNKTEN